LRWFCNQGQFLALKLKNNTQKLSLIFQYLDVPETTSFCFPNYQRRSNFILQNHFKYTLYIIMINKRW
jgi:hypothetical protein